MRDDPATDRQKDYISVLAHKAYGEEAAEWLLAKIPQDGEPETLTRAQASAMIDGLREECEEAARRRAAELDEARRGLAPGVYRGADGGVYRVYRASGGDHLLAERLDDDGRFVYAGAAARFVRPEGRMGLEEAKEHGRRTGRCMMCGRLLTNKESIAAGIGPVCGRRV